VSDAQRKPDFETLASDYAKYRTSYSDALFDAILAYARPPRGGRVLDIACGTGLGLLPYVRRGLSVIGIDVAPAMMQEARRLLPPDAKVEFRVGKAEALPVDDACVDLVSCAQAFHWFDPKPAFSECARVLVTGGAIAIFWKHAASGDALTRTSEEIVREWLGPDAVARSRDHADEHIKGWDAFWEHVAPEGEQARGRPFVDGRKEVIEFSLPRTGEEFVGYQRSREKIRMVLGERRDAYFKELECRLRARGPMDEPVEQLQVQYCFFGRKRS